MLVGPSNFSWHLGTLAGREIIGRQISQVDEEIAKITQLLEIIQSLDPNAKKWDRANVATVMGAIGEYCPQFVCEISEFDTVQFLMGARSAVLGETEPPSWHLGET